jgi:hypothetical protein
MTNTVAYYDTEMIRPVKGYIELQQ